MNGQPSAGFERNWQVRAIVFCVYVGKYLQPVVKYYTVVADTKPLVLKIPGCINCLSSSSNECVHLVLTLRKNFSFKEFFSFLGKICPF